MPSMLQAVRQIPLGMPMIQAGVTAQNPPPDAAMQIASAMVDTGADHCLLHVQIANALGLAPTGRSLSLSGAGMQQKPAGSVWAALHFKGDQKGLSIGPIELAVSDTLDCGLLLGWQALQHFDLQFAKSGAFSLRWD